MPYSNGLSATTQHCQYNNTITDNTLQHQIHHDDQVLATQTNSNANEWFQVSSAGVTYNGIVVYLRGVTVGDMGVGGHVW